MRNILHKIAINDYFALNFAHEHIRHCPNCSKQKTGTAAYSILRDLLLNSDMITAVSLQWFYYERMAGELRVLDFDLQKTARMIGITRRQESHFLPGAVALIEAIREVVADLENSTRS
jgi:hypothetical protein